MPDLNQPLLSVVVPIYNVGSYLRPCLDSLLGQKVKNVEIICVNDGSTDGSGEVAEEYAQRDARLQVLHVPNGGLGRARNIGTEAAQGRYLAFVDSDDRVPVDGYELMCASLDRTGSDIATGMVLRFTDTRSWRSGLHTKAIRRSAQATHISLMPSLINDTTAWNKVFRRSFWDEHGFTFPEGVLYEDIPVTIPAHVLARRVDVFNHIVYEWRERGDGSVSITQARSELKNLQDRLSALESASDFLLRHGDETLVRAHDRRVLTNDIALYVDVLDIADDEYQKLLASHLRQYLRHVDKSILRQIPVWERVAYELLVRDRISEALNLLQTRKAERRAYRLKRRGIKLYAELPYFRDRSVGVPDETYAVTKSVRVRSGVEEAEIRDGKLVIRGYAMIEGLPLQSPWSAVRYVVLRDPVTRRRIMRPVRPVHRPDLTAEHGKSNIGYDWAGFEVSLPLNKVPAPAAEGTSTNYEVQIKIAAPATRRGVALATVPTATLARPTAIRPDGTHISLYNSGTLKLAVTRAPALARRVNIDVAAGSLECELQLPHQLPSGATLSWRCEQEASREVSAPLTTERADPLLARASFRLSDFDLLGPGRDWREWQAMLGTPVTGAAAQRATPGADATGPDQGLPVLVHPDFVEHRAAAFTPGRELVVRPGPAGRLQLDDRRSRVVVDGFAWERGQLLLRVTLPAHLQALGEDVHVLLHHRDGLDLMPDSATRSGSAAELRFPVLLANARSVTPGTWALHVREGEVAHERLIAIDVDERCAQQPDTLAEVEQVTALVLAGGHRFHVRVRSGRERERGNFNQQVLRTGFYASAQQRTLQESVLFMSWGGTQYSCNPRAIFEEMQRQGRDERVLWVRRNTSVEVPEGIPFVQMWSREYYEALATARRVVANDAMPPYFAKRSGASYLQTWHGTPLKKIGLDIENIQFGSRYLETFALDVAQWDSLVSPNPYSSEIFRRAFDYQGSILETGYPRNDVFYAEDIEERAQAVRKRLDLHPDQRVVLWAPTWRDNQRDRSGRYQLPLPFDLAAWQHILKPDDILLFRGHQLVQSTMSAKLTTLDMVRNVTRYPDIQDLYLIADVLITDYSSVMFDFANTRRPMIFYAWDLDKYRDELRGFYVDFESEVPGPVVTDIDALRAALADPGSDAATAERYERFVQRYCGLEDGHAAARVVSAMFGD